MNTFKRNHTRRYNQGGFTLIELMVALTLFVIVVLAAVSSLYTVNNASRRVESMRTVLDNLNFAMESMSRTIRTGYEYTCGGIGQTIQNCNFENSNGTDKLYLKTALGIDSEIEYSWIINADGKGQIVKRVYDTGSSSWSNAIAITAPEIDIQGFAFYVDGAESGDSTQPSVMIFAQGVASTEDQNSAPFAVQTYISQRATE